MKTPSEMLEKKRAIKRTSIETLFLPVFSHYRQKVSPNKMGYSVNVFKK